MDIQKIATFAALPVAAFVLGAAVFSAPAPQEPEAPVPTKWHKVMAKGVGVWDAKLSMTMAPGSEAVHFTGSETNKLILNDMWMTSTFKADMMGIPFEGRALVGYDKQTKKVKMVWIDSMNETWSLGEGIYSKDGKILTTMMEGRDPMTGKMKTTMSVEEWHGDGKRVLTMSDRDENGDWVPNMTIEYTRKVEPVMTK